MSRADLTALIARVEAARGADAMIDYQITWAAYPELALKWRDKTEAFYTPQGQRVRVLPYTSSIDAAVTLVPKGWAWDVRRMYPGGSVHGAHHTGEAHLDRWSDRDFRTEGAKAFVRVTAATPALALTAAALRARLAMMGDDA